MEISNLTVATSTIVGMFASLIVIVLVTVMSMAFAKGKYEGRFRIAILGAMVYIAPVSILAFILRVLCGAIFSANALTDPTIIAFVQAVPLGIACVLMINLFERLFVKKENAFGDTIAFCTGFGSAYAVIQCGIGVVISLMTALSIKGQTVQELVDTAQKNELGEIEESIRTIAESRWSDYVFKTTGTICVMAIMIMTTLIVYECLQFGSKALKLIANLELVVALLVWQYTSARLSSLVSLLIIIVLTALIGLLTYIVMKNLREK